MKEVPCELTGQALAVLNAMTGRAEYLYHILKAMDEAGIKNADEILKKAIHKVGRTWAEKLGECRDPSELWHKLLNDDLKKILKLDWVADKGEYVELHFHRCPLVFGWQRMGLDEKTVARLCEIANQVDYGNMESFGFKLDMDPGCGHGKDKCVLKIKK